MGRTLIRRSLVAALVIASLPVSIARAADIQPVVTLDPIAPVVYRGELDSMTAHVSDGAGGVFFQVSTDDGATWETFAGSSQAGDGWSQSSYISSTFPLGMVLIRAHVYAQAGFLEASSEPQEREVRRRQAVITDFRIVDPNGGAILPRTDPVRVYGAASHASMLDQWVDGDWLLIGGGGVSWWTELAAPGVGEHRFRLRVDTTDLVVGASQELTLDITKAASVPVWSAPLTVQAHHAMEAQVSFTGPGRFLPDDGLMTVTNVASGVVIATGNPGMQFTVPPLNAGPHDFLVSFTGNEDYEASSKTFTVTATADSVDASGVGLNYSAFYPYKDGYRDTVTVRGNRLEPLSVAIRIYSSTGALVKSSSFSRAAGSYRYAWNGRTSSGALRPSGKYRVVQTLTDAAGTTKAFTSYVSLSHKRIVLKTAYVTKLGSSVSAKGDEGSGSIATSTSNGYVRLTGKYPGGWVGVGYQFTIPSATLYKSIAFQVYSKGPLVAASNQIGLQSFATCPYSSSSSWYEDCFNHWAGIGGSATTPSWKTASGHVTNNRYNRTVRGMVSVNAGTFYIYKARVKVVYGVLQ